MSLDNVLNNYCQLATSEELYITLFHIGEGYIQSKGEYRDEEGKEFKGNPIVYFSDTENYQGKMKRNILLEDTFLDQLRETQKYPSNLLNACTYYGRKKDKEHADKCFGLIFDIDDIDDVTINRFLFGCNNDIYPTPNFIVVSKSGCGMHLYYIFDKPIRLFPKIKIQLKSLKHDLTKWIWNPLISNNEKIQYQSFDQSFMIAGTIDTMSVWKFREELYGVEELFDLDDMVFDKDELWIESKYTLEEAKAKFPQWYEKVIVNGDNSKGQWFCKRDLYDWWIRKILDPRNGASYGHRYWCTMMLVIYAVKCGIEVEEVKADAYKLMHHMNMLKPDVPFTEADVQSALDCYDSQFATFPIDDISRLSAIEIKKNKRNGRNQDEHMAVMRAIQSVVNPNWRDGNGRNTKQAIVEEWQRKNPNGKKVDCIKDTGLSKKTVYKWWK